jgi:hypothetical protein
LIVPTILETTTNNVLSNLEGKDGGWVRKRREKRREEVGKRTEEEEEREGRREEEGRVVCMW